MNRSILLIAAAVLVCGMAQAQEPAPVVSLRFLSFPQNENLKPIELLIGENKTIPIDIPSNELSRSYKVPAMATIAVGATGQNEKKEAVFQVYGKAPSIASPVQIVLLVRKGPNNEDGFTVVPLDGNLRDFPGGGYQFINAAQMGISGKIGDKTFNLTPGQRTLLRPTADHEGGGCQVTLAYQKEAKWKIFYDTRWTVNPRYRALVFFYQDQETGKLGVAPIMEIL